MQIINNVYKISNFSKDFEQSLLRLHMYAFYMYMYELFRKMSSAE